MRSFQARTDIRASGTTGNQAARLELLEYFLTHHDDLVPCAQASLDWLARFVGIKQSACLLADHDTGMLMAVAVQGAVVDDPPVFAWPLSQIQNPLIAALASSGPVWFKASRTGGHILRPVPRTPLGQIGRAHV